MPDGEGRSDGPGEARDDDDRGKHPQQAHQPSATGDRCFIPVAHRGHGDRRPPEARLYTLGGTAPELLGIGPPFQQPHQQADAEQHHAQQPDREEKLTRDKPAERGEHAAPLGLHRNGESRGVERMAEIKRLFALWRHRQRSYARVHFAGGDRCDQALEVVLAQLVADPQPRSDLLPQLDADAAPAAVGLLHCEWRRFLGPHHPTACRVDGLGRRHPE